MGRYSSSNSKRPLQPVTRSHLIDPNDHAHPPHRLPFKLANVLVQQLLDSRIVTAPISQLDSAVQLSSALRGGPECGQRVQGEASHQVAISRQVPVMLDGAPSPFELLVRVPSSAGRATLRVTAEMTMLFVDGLWRRQIDSLFDVRLARPRLRLVSENAGLLPCSNNRAVCKGGHLRRRRIEVVLDCGQGHDARRQGAKR